MIAIWIILPAFCTMMTCISTDIIDGVCVPWGVFGYFAKFAFLISIITNYVLPVVLMIFCYSRVVYALRTKVTTSSLSDSLGPEHR